MSTYAAYYNLSQADRAARLAESRRTSENSVDSTTSTSSTSSKSSAFKRVMNGLRVTEEVVQPSGIYTPIIKRGPLFSGLKPSKAVQEPTPIYAGLAQRSRPLFGRTKKTQDKN